MITLLVSLTAVVMLLLCACTAVICGECEKQTDRLIAQLRLMQSPEALALYHLSGRFSQALAQAKAQGTEKP